MDAGNFRTIYDIASEGHLTFSGWIIAWTVGVIVMAVLFFFQIKTSGFKFTNTNERLGVIILPIFLTAGLCGIGNSYSIQSECLIARNSGDYKIVEGVIREMVPDPKRQRFKVNGVNFEHREYDGTQCGLKPSKARVLRNELRVKIFSYKGQTLRLEVAE